MIAIFHKSFDEAARMVYVRLSEMQGEKNDTVQFTLKGMAMLTGLPQSRVSRAVAYLVNRNMLEVIGDIRLTEKTVAVLEVPSTFQRDEEIRQKKAQREDQLRLAMKRKRQ